MEGWTVYPDDEWNSRVFIDNNGSGQQMRLQRYDWNAGWTDGKVMQVVNVCPQSDYVLSCLAGGGIHESTKYGYIALEEVQNSSLGKKIQIDSEDMSTYTMNYTTSANCKQLRVVFGLKSPGAIGEWGSVPMVPINVDDVALEGKGVVTLNEAFGYNATDGAEVSAITLDPNGAYAPTMAAITTDKDVLTIDGTKGETYATLKITGTGLRSSEMITFNAPAGVTVVPSRIPSTSNGRTVKVLYDGTRTSFSDELTLRSGETTKVVTINAKGAPLAKGALTNKIEGVKEFTVPSFDPKRGYTMEIHTKVAPKMANGVRLYASNSNGNGYCINLGDSVISVYNPKAKLSNPDTLLCAKNSTLQHTYRVAVAGDDRMFVWRDGNPADTVLLSDYILPKDFLGTNYATSNDNLLRNADFNGEVRYDYMSDDGDKALFAHYIEGWDIYPIEGWNTRQYIVPWEVDESEALGLGNKALKLERYGWNKGWSDGYISQAVPVIAGQTYNLNVLAAGGINAAVKYGYIRLEEVQSPKTGVELPITSDTPQYYNLSYTPTAQCKELRVVFGLKSPGAIGSWGSVPEVPIYVDNPVLTGPKVYGLSALGFVADNNSDVDYFAYSTDGAFAPTEPEIETSSDEIIINGTGKSELLRITGHDLVPGEKIYLSCPGNFSLSKTELEPDVKAGNVVVKMLSTLKRCDGYITLRSGRTVKRVHVIGKGTTLPERELSGSPVYTGNADTWSISQADGFNPEDGYTVEFKVSNQLLNSRFEWFGATANNGGINPVHDGSSISVRNGSSTSKVLTVDDVDNYTTYRYAVASDGRVFVYRDRAPIDTLYVHDYAMPVGYAGASGSYSENLLHNSGFDEASTTYIMDDDPDREVFTDYIEGWTITDPHNGWNTRSHIVTERINDEYGDFNQVMALERYRWESGYESVTTQTVPIVPNTEYVLTAMAKGGISKSGSTPLAYIRLEETQNTDLGTTVKVETNDYRQYTIKYTPSNDCEQLRVVLGFKTAGKGTETSMAKFDNVRLEGYARQLTPKLGFEKANTNMAYFTYDLTGAYAPILPNISIGSDDEEITFDHTLAERKLKVSTSNVLGNEVKLTATGNFVVEPSVIPANSGDVDVTVTFVGLKDSEGALRITADAMTAEYHLSGTASELEQRDLSTGSATLDSNGNLELTSANGFNPGLAGYTVELKGELERDMGGSFEISAVNSNEVGFTVSISEEFMATAYDRGTIRFIGGEDNTNIGNNTYRLTVAPDNSMLVFKNSELIETLNLKDYPINSKFIRSGESVQSDNLLRNPGFSGNYEYTQYDEAYMLSSLEGWTLSGIDEWNARAYLNADSDNPGNNILSIERYEWNAGWADGIATQVVNVVPGETYTFSALLRGGAGSGYNLAYMGYEEVGTGVSKSMNVSSSSNDFAQKSMTFKASQNCNQVRLMFWVKASGEKPGPKCKFYIKDVALDGAKPVYNTALYLHSDGDFKINYFNYDLTGAYVPVGFSDLDDVELPEAKLEAATLGGNLYLNGVAQGATVRVYNTSGMLITQISNYCNNTAIALPQTGIYIVAVADNSGVQTLKVLNK
jgi:hypothetical protein